ncbi:MAG: hypothetical protein IMY76_08610 [Chloroflexi bacterium]|nr:hypothetical protein [Chloroflexota bacterium]
MSLTPTPELLTVIQTVEVTRLAEVTRIVEIPVTITPSLTPIISSTATLTQTITPTPTVTFTSTITPTSTPLNSTVLQQSNCRYGPGAAYLYKYGLYEGYRAIIIGRNLLGDWAYVQALGFPDPCWVKASLLEIAGDIYSVEPYYARLPFSALYQPPQGAHAERNGDQVTISWQEVWMTEDDYRGYLIEAWLCKDGQVVFTALRSDVTIVNVIDEAGCMEPSSAKLYTAEKHGYTSWVPIPWPDHNSE